MATNKFLKFDESDANMLDYATYLANTMRTGGFPFGSKPPSDLTNRFYRDTAGFVYAFGEFMKTQGLDASPDDLATLIANLALTTPSASSMLTGIKTVDGAGSGLDSDLLDGKHYLDILKQFGGATSVSGVLDWNDNSNCNPGTSATLLLGTAANGPGLSWYYHCLSFEYSSKDGTGNITQFAIPLSGSGSLGTENSDLYFRGRASGTWTAWKRIWTENGLRTSSGYLEYFSGGVWIPVGLICTKYRRNDFSGTVAVANTYYDLVNVTGKGRVNRIDTGIYQCIGTWELTIDGVVQDLMYGNGNSVMVEHIINAEFLVSLRIRHKANNTTGTLISNIDYAMV